MEDTRKGFLKPEQEKQADYLWKNKGVVEAVDGPAITLVDNQILERLKAKLVEKYPDVLPIVYEVVDALFEVLPNEEPS